MKESIFRTIQEKAHIYDAHLHRPLVETKDDLIDALYGEIDVLKQTIRDLEHEKDQAEESCCCECCGCFDD